MKSGLENSNGCPPLPTLEATARQVLGWSGLVGDDVLSADLVLTDREVLAEFQERCEEAAETHDRRNMHEVSSGALSNARFRALVPQG